jgi:hypothetical protein
MQRCTAICQVRLTAGRLPGGAPEHPKNPPGPYLSLRLGVKAAGCGRPLFDGRRVERGGTPKARSSTMRILAEGLARGLQDSGIFLGPAGLPALSCLVRVVLP